MTEALLQTKLKPPPLRPQRVRRKRLDDKFAQCVDVPLTLVSAPAGFGKTTATALALHELAGNSRLAWLSLETHDDEPVRFWHYFIAALQNVLKGIGQDMAKALNSPQPPPARSLLANLLNELAGRPEQIFLVIDDYHLIKQAEIHDGLALLVEQAASGLHLVLVTRVDPPLPLHRLRARAQLVEVRAQDLRFNLEEASRFLTEVMDVSVSADEVGLLLQQTEGWAAGLQLAALALRGAAAAPGLAVEQRGLAQQALIERLAQSNRYVLEYLTEEVLAQQPPEIQSFLLKTSILQRLNGSLCNAVTGRSDSATLLETLARQNLFVLPTAPSAGLDVSARWYRYHNLFATLLQGYLRQRYGDEVEALNRRAAAWCAEHGSVEVAIDYAFAAEDYDRVAHLLETHAHDFIMQGQARTLEQWMQELPERWQRTLTKANVEFGWALLLRGRYGEIETCIASAEAAGALHDPLLRGELFALRAALADTQGQAAKALEYAQRALDEVPEDNRFAHALATFALAGALRETEQSDAAIAAYERALPLCRAAGLPLPEMLARAHLGFLYMARGQLQRAAAVTRPAGTPMPAHPTTGPARIVLALALTERNELLEAERLVHEGIDLARQSGHNATLVQAYNLLSRLRRAQGDMDGAQGALEEAAALVEQGAPAWVEPMLLAAQVALWLEQGAIGSAEQALAQVKPGSDGHVREVLPLAHARLLLSRGTDADLRAAETVLDEVLQTAAAGARQGRVVEALLLRALLKAAQEDAAAAQTNLQHALQLAEPEGYVRLFVEAGAPLAKLLAQEEGAYARRLLGAFPEPLRESAGAAASTLPEPLTEREMDVLQRMARGLTYQQIADELVVSVNTVRHHVKGIYSKLAVDKRTLALQKARMLGLL